MSIQNHALFSDSCKGPKPVISDNLSKNNSTQWPTSSGLKIKFDPSLDRSLCEFFKTIKNHGPKIHPRVCNLGPKYSARGWSLVRKKWQLSCPVWRFHDFVCTKDEMNAPDTEDVRRNSDGFGPKNVVFYIEKCII